MGTITINIKDEIEREFRETVGKLKGIGKGKLGESISEALDRWVYEQRQKEIAQEMIAVMEKGFGMGKLKIKSREELYDR